MKWLKSIIEKSKQTRIDRARTVKRKTYIAANRVFRMGGGWGNAINWQDVDKGRVVGWKTPKPKVGDLVIINMEKGEPLVSRFLEIEHCEHVGDMFFGMVEIECFEWEDIEKERESAA